MEAISNLIGPLGMIKSVNLNWATYSPGIKDKKQDDNSGNKHEPYDPGNTNTTLLGFDFSFELSGTC